MNFNMQQQGYQLSKNIGTPGGKIVKIVQVSNANYVAALQGFNTIPIRSVTSSNTNNVSSDVLGTILAHNQLSFASNPNSQPSNLLSSNISDGISLGQQVNPPALSSGMTVGSSQHNSSRKPCNCTKSHCLKLYCECFANGQLCDMCNCTNCMNNLNFEEERGRAIKMTLDRNPTAFHPKIGRGEGERKHTKGCNCKRSGCLKNYCECYEAKISCTDSCRCQGCKNTEDSIERRSLKRLAAMSSLKSHQPNAITKNLTKPLSERLPHAFLTWEIIEAITNCLLAKAEEVERSDISTEQQERKLLEIFGLYLNKVIETSRSALYNNNHFSNIIVDNHIISGDVLRSISHDVRRDHISDKSDIIDDEEGDDELDVDLEDSMVINEDDDYEDDAEVIYSQRNNVSAETSGSRSVRRRGRPIDNIDPAWRPGKSKVNRQYYLPSTNRSRSRKNYDDM